MFGGKNNFFRKPFGPTPGRGRVAAIRAQNAQKEQDRQDMFERYMDPENPGSLLFSPSYAPDIDAIKGLELGKLLTGQTLGQTGGQIQDLLKKQLALTSNGANNPITAALQTNKAQALASTEQELARAGVKGGAAAAAKLQTSRKLDRDIAAQAYQQYQDALVNARQMISGVASAQLSPMYQAQQAGFAARTPEYKPDNRSSFLGITF